MGVCVPCRLLSTTRGRVHSFSPSVGASFPLVVPSRRIGGDRRRWSTRLLPFFSCSGSSTARDDGRRGNAVGVNTRAGKQKGVADSSIGVGLLASSSSSSTSSSSSGSSFIENGRHMAAVTSFFFLFSSTPQEEEEEMDASWACRYRCVRAMARTTSSHTAFRKRVTNSSSRGVVVRCRREADASMGRRTRRNARRSCSRSSLW